MNAVLNMFKRFFPHLKKALPFVGTLFAGIASFFLGAKWKANQCEKRYAKVCELVMQQEARLRQLEADRAPRRDIRQAKRELKGITDEKTELERQLESLRQAS